MINKSITLICNKLHHHTIAPISHTDFHTENDNIHWTISTGQKNL